MRQQEELVSPTVKRIYHLLSGSCHGNSYHGAVGWITLLLFFLSIFYSFISVVLDTFSFDTESYTAQKIEA